MTKVFKNELEGKRLVWEDAKIGTFTIAEVLGEDGVIEFKARLSGYKVERMDKKAK